MATHMTCDVCGHGDEVVHVHVPGSTRYAGFDRDLCGGCRKVIVDALKVTESLDKKALLAKRVKDTAEWRSVMASLD
jgi:predicted RNA-binding protein with PUA domain